MTVTLEQAETAGWRGDADRGAKAPDRIGAAHQDRAVPKEIIKARYSAAEAQVRISEAATGGGEELADVGLTMQRAVDKTEHMKARGDAVSELEAAGMFDDLTALGSGEDDIDRQLRELSTTSEVDSELEK